MTPWPRRIVPSPLQALEALIPEGAFAGSRYDAIQMKHLDRER